MPEMATRAVVVAEQPRGGGENLKNGQGEGRRRALGDIGNLVTAAPVRVDGKLEKQINGPFGGFCAQLMANAQAAAGNYNNKKPLVEIVNDVAPKRIAAKKEVGVVKPVVGQKKSQMVIEISSDEESKAKKKKPVAAARKSRGGSGMERKTLTSVLTARSTASCGLTTRPKEVIANIDAVDADNELAVVEYVEDIYKFYKQTEDEGRVRDYMDSQPDINTKMRSILMDWLVDVHRKFELMPETLYLTINIVDRFLSMKIVSRRELQLVGLSAMLIACKYEEIWAPEVSDFIGISDSAYVREQILVMEKVILGKLEWYLTVPTPYVFLVRYIKASVPVDQDVEKMAFFIVELGLLYYPTVINFCPSMLAAAAVYTARCTLNKNPSWTETLKHHTSYSEDQLKECTKMLLGFYSEAAGSNLKAVYRKFSSPDQRAVALIPPAKGLLVAAAALPPNLGMK